MSDPVERQHVEPDDQADLSPFERDLLKSRDEQAQAIHEHYWGPPKGFSWGGMWIDTHTLADLPPRPESERERRLRLAPWALDIERERPTQDTQARDERPEDPL